MNDENHHSRIRPAGRPATPGRPAMHGRIMIWLLAAAVGVWGTPRVKAAMEFLDFKQREYAHIDIVNLTGATRSYRSPGGSYEDISVQVLSGRGVRPDGLHGRAGRERVRRGYRRHGHRDGPRQGPGDL